MKEIFICSICIDWFDGLTWWHAHLDKVSYKSSQKSIWSYEGQIFSTFCIVNFNTFLLIEMLMFFLIWNFPAIIYLFKVNRNTRRRCELCSNLSVKTSGQRQWTYLNIIHTFFWWFYWHFDLISNFIHRW